MAMSSSIFLTNPGAVLNIVGFQEKKFLMDLSTSCFARIIFSMIHLFCLE